jgi:hypothetical protein
MVFRLLEPLKLIEVEVELAEVYPKSILKGSKGRKYGRKRKKV